MRDSRQAETSFLVALAQTKSPHLRGAAARRFKGEPVALRQAAVALNLLAGGRGRPALALIPVIPRLESEPTGPALLAGRKGRLQLYLLNQERVCSEGRFAKDPNALTVFALRAALERDPAFCRAYGDLLRAREKPESSERLAERLRTAAKALLVTCAAMGLDEPETLSWGVRMSIKRDFFDAARTSLRKPALHLRAVMSHSKAFEDWTEGQGRASDTAARIVTRPESGRKGRA